VTHQSHSGVDTTLRKIAAELAEKPFYPLTSTGCAFAGDSGLLHQELTRSVAREEAGKVAARIWIYLTVRTGDLRIRHGACNPRSLGVIPVGAGRIDAALNSPLQSHTATPARGNPHSCDYI
jgi:hypothetical protein